MRITGGNIFSPAPVKAADEDVTVLLATESVRIERIVSHGHASPEGFWYDQEEAEWVIVLKGSAELLFEHEGAPRLLWPGDYVHIPAHARHRVTATDPHKPTIWLAVHLTPGAAFTDR
jgi:cupin 2 domain-containing protein